jgi:hypothetical protein
MKQQKTNKQQVPNPQEEAQSRMTKLHQLLVTSFVFLVCVAIFLKIIFF